MEEKHPEGHAQADSVQNEIAQNEPPRLTNEKQIAAASPFTQRFRQISVQSETRQLVDWIDKTVGSESYGATRVFDLFTLLAVTVGFALMFAMLKLAEPIFEEHLPKVFWAFTAYIVCIAVAQQWAFRGKKPRLASILLGPVAFMVVAFSLLLYQQRIAPIENLVLACMLLLVMSVATGSIIGYVAGGAIAGVFFLADKFRNYCIRPEATVVEDPESMWDSEK